MLAAPIPPVGLTRGDASGLGDAYGLVVGVVVLALVAALAFAFSRWGKPAQSPESDAESLTSDLAA